MTQDEITPTLTLVDEYKTGELIPKMRKIAVDNIRRQRERGMPRELSAYEIGINITVNGRHFSYLGSTVGAKREYRMTAADVFMCVAKCLMPYISDDPSKPVCAKPLTENEYNLFFRRDNDL